MKLDKQVDLNLATPCGSYCSECTSYKKRCAGCGYVKGKPFWGECRFCPCVREKGVEHCGLCQDFPCDYFLATYDPSGGKWRVFYRIGQLVYRKRIGSRAWMEEKIKGENLDPKYKE